MPKLKVLSGDDVVRIFETFGFQVKDHKGSHAKLTRFHNGDRQILTIPRHDEIDKGTLKAIYRQGLKYISEVELKPRFYTN